jgi:hypothetical protein
MLYFNQLYDMYSTPSLQIFYELVTLLNVSVDQFFFPNQEIDKCTQRKQLDSLLDNISDKGLRIVSATAEDIREVEAGDE